MSQTDRRRTEFSGLPAGWKRVETVRKNGLSTGNTDIYYISPDGQKILNKRALSRALGPRFDIAAFDFRTGRISHPSNIYKRSRHDSSIAVPIRQTASIFKQPVTVIRNHADSRTRTDIKHGCQEMPRQLFWEKRLEGLVASDMGGQTLSFVKVPHFIKGTSPELLKSENLLQSIVAALHLNNQPIIGQTASKNLLQRNTVVNMCISQPLVENVIVSDADIAQQEQKVREARRRLQRALAAFNKTSLDQLTL